MDSELKGKTLKFMQNLENHSFFRIYIEVDTYESSKNSKLCTEEELKKIKEKKKGQKTKEWNNQSIINLENWEQLKDVFFNQRMETYNSNLTHTEKINLEIGKVEKLDSDLDRYKILKTRYIDYLKKYKPQPTIIEKLSDLITHEKSNIIVEKLKIQYKNNTSLKSDINH